MTSGREELLVGDGMRVEERSVTVTPVLRSMVPRDTPEVDIGSWSEDVELDDFRTRGFTARNTPIAGESRNLLS